ncbi:hypothetical protein ACFY2K_43160 [Kitasatospora sp. NPDC001309]|uniref:hypothetical protein n=1 Tax=Kitasatospora sp. NPDC001309 TaxID=3364013 RepID=UPI0036C6DCD7
MWSIPAKWADVLDRWRAGHVALLARARRCGAMATRAQQYEWRSEGGFLARLECVAHSVRWEESVGAHRVTEWVADPAAEHS